MSTIINLPLPHEAVRIGYHRVSDDSVSSGVWAADSLRETYVGDLKRSPDIDSAWYRLGNEELPFYIKIPEYSYNESLPGDPSSWIELRVSDCPLGCKVYRHPSGSQAVAHNSNYGCYR